MTKRINQQEDTRLVAIRAAIEPVLVAHAVELCDLGWFQEPAGRTLRLTIERLLPASEGGEPEAWKPGAWKPERGFGVNLDDCAEVSRDVSTVLDALEVADASAPQPLLDPPLAEEYLLEVSSPGLDRALHGARDFVRFRGALAKVKLAKPAPDGQRVLRGVIVEASADKVALTVDGKRFEVALANVAEANLVFELPSVPKRASQPKKAAEPKKGAPRSASAPKLSPPKAAKTTDSKIDTTVKGSIRRAG